MHQRFLALAAVAALGFFTAISGVSFAEEGVQTAPDVTATPEPAPPIHADTDPNQAASPDQQSPDTAHETEVEPESIPPSEE